MHLAAWPPYPGSRRRDRGTIILEGGGPRCGMNSGKSVGMSGIICPRATLSIVWVSYRVRDRDNKMLEGGGQVCGKIKLGGQLEFTGQSSS